MLLIMMLQSPLAAEIQGKSRVAFNCTKISPSDLLLPTQGKI